MAVRIRSENGEVKRVKAETIERRIRIAQMILDRPGITRAELSETLCYGARAIQYDLIALRDDPEYTVAVTAALRLTRWRGTRGRGDKGYRYAIGKLECAEMLGERIAPVEADDNGAIARHAS